MTVHHPFSYPIGIFTFTGFGIAVLLAFAIAQVICQRELQRRGYDPEPIGDLVFAAVIGGLLGAKIYYVILTGDITTLWSRGGFVFWGGLIGGIVAVFLVIHRKQLNAWRISDVAGIGIAAAYSIGRTGCWAVGDDYGRVWNGPLAVSFPRGAPASTVANMNAEFHANLPASLSPDTVVSVYPTQLLEVLLGLVMFWILWRLRKHEHGAGWLFGMYCVLAGIERFIVEFFRAKGDIVGPLTSAQWVALAIGAFGALLLTTRRGATALAVAR
jgi:phosphatidylglycerol:prolipoprotein diacylglycerol transferase